MILAKRKTVYRAARTRTPRRRSGDTRNWTPIVDVALNLPPHAGDPPLTC